MNTSYGIGGALQDVGGNIMQMAFGNMIEERKKQAANNFFNYEKE
jgi:hypothetical protein